MGRTYGGSAVTQARSLVYADDGGFLLADRRGGVVKTDEDGRVAWRAVLAPDVRSSLWSAAQTDGGEYVFGGWVERSEEYAGWFVRLDSAGSTVVTRTFDTADDARARGRDYTVAELFTALTVTDDGIVVLVGKNATRGRVQKLGAAASVESW